MEYLDIVDETGTPTGKTVSRREAHAEGIPHRTAHVWIVRRVNGRTEILLQKRSGEKDSFPGLYDTSSAGHIPAGEEPVPSALRELSEELGIRAAPSQLHYAGQENPVFTEDAMKSIFTFSGGNPRLVNRACSQSLIYGAQMKQTCIDSKSVDIVLENEVTGAGH